MDHALMPFRRCPRRPSTGIWIFAVAASATGEAKLALSVSMVVRAED